MSYLCQMLSLGSRAKPSIAEGRRRKYERRSEDRNVVLKRKVEGAGRRAEISRVSVLVQRFQRRNTFVYARIVVARKGKGKDYSPAAVNRLYFLACFGFFPA